ncbi:hypothetical protein J2741_001439 [Methanolinea mesophila]|uniref:gasdermin n=1 Tax=Methanolinea mesophila TaxID=547055 RepID=UPI001AE9AD44|nr:hypothetical protein [Methanolinea mesophila]MBP1928892.1 hypothetical protein [Methanolinea mesophila]
MGDKDSFQELLFSEKYVILKIPREGISPLMIIGREEQGDEFELFGTIEDMFTSEQALPKIGEDNVAVNISGKNTGRVSLSLGLKLMNTFLEAFQAKMGINVSSEKADTAEIIFSDVYSSMVMPLQVRHYVTNASLRYEEDRKLLDPKGKTFVITEVLKTALVKIKIYDRDGKSVGMEGEIGTPASGHFSAEKDNVKEKILSYEGDKKVIFAFRAIPIWYDGNRPVVGCFTIRGHDEDPKVEYLSVPPDSSITII